MKLEAHGISVNVPEVWEGEIYHRPVSEFDKAQGATTRPVVHLANFTLPVERGDYGSAAVERMRPGDTFLAVLEFEPEARATALFAEQSIPRLTGDDFGRNNLQRPLPGQAGAQAFFHTATRAFCVYAVIGDFHDRFAAATEINSMLDTMVVTE